MRVNEAIRGDRVDEGYRVHALSLSTTTTIAVINNQRHAIGEGRSLSFSLSLARAHARLFSLERMVSDNIRNYASMIQSL